MKRLLLWLPLALFAALFGLVALGLFKPADRIVRSAMVDKPLPDFPSPSCIAVDRPLGGGVNLSYRFKRAYLSRWAAITTGVDGLLKRFSAQPR